MNILLWILQFLLALHTITGAIWKFSNSEQAIPSLSSIPHGVWMALIGIEFLCSLCLTLPSVNKNMAILAPVAAACIAAEMLLFTVVHLFSGVTDPSQMIYWLVVAGICSFIAYGRFRLKPL